jgi:hypothetical protein
VGISAFPTTPHLTNFCCPLSEKLVQINTFSGWKIRKLSMNRTRAKCIGTCYRIENLSSIYGKCMNFFLDISPGMALGRILPCNQRIPKAVSCCYKMKHLYVVLSLCEDTPPYIFVVCSLISRTSLIMRNVDSLRGNDREISSYTTAVAR